jgi:hypothetical protein
LKSSAMWIRTGNVENEKANKPNLKSQENVSSTK